VQPRRYTEVVVILYLLAALLLPSLLLADGQDDASIDQSLKTLVDVFTVVKQEAADPVPPNKAIYEGAIPGMLRRLDPHTVFFDPGQFQQLQEMEKSTQKGFGTIVSLLPGRVVILQVMPNTPGARSGLTPGDEILAVNNIPLNRLDVEQLVQVLSETRRRQANIDVRRPGNARLLQFVLTPEEIDAPSVERAFLIKPGIGYVRVTSFDAKAGEQVREAVESLGADSLKGLVLDLRNNPGGLMPAALETASLFLEVGQKIVSVRGRRVRQQDINVPSPSKPYKFPLAVLVNGKSASGSEIVAGALQDLGRAKVIGEPTFGKGLVQSVFPLSEGTGLALTTAFYYTPSGRSIQRPLAGQLSGTTAREEGSNGGIQPDRVVYPENPSRLRAALEMSGAFTSFATDYLQRNGKVAGDWNVSPAVLDEFRVSLSQRRFQPSIAEWSREVEWTRSRLRQEILNQSIGVAKGDEIEVRRDPVVAAAIEAIER
jgi:carboxyl-terminal processing protease